MRLTGWKCGVSSAALLCCIFPMAVHAQTLLGPSVYTSFTNSPFNGGSFSYFHLENFESGSLTVPGVIASAGTVIGPGALVDSVDGDDGVIDGSGQNGRAFFQNTGLNGIQFTFSSGTLGQLPTHVGIVWTDGSNNIRFEAFDGANNSLGFLTGSHAEANFTGETSEDRFYGIISSGGIGSIFIQSGVPTGGGGLEVDHLQYGFAAVPEPATLILASSSVLAAGIILKQRVRLKRKMAKRK